MFHYDDVLKKVNISWALLYEGLKGFLRFVVLVVSCLAFATWCTHVFEHVEVWGLAEQMEQDAAHTVTGLPDLVWVLLVPFHRLQYIRYAFLPAGAFLFVFISSAFYVRDIYHLPHLTPAFHYVFSSLFAFSYPMIRVDGGRIDGEDPDDEDNIHLQHVLRAIGGPGFVQIQPGNAVAFRNWRDKVGVEHSRLYFMRPFEMIARVVNLEDQHGHIGESPAMTRDGIRVRLKNIDYRFSVSRPPVKSQPLPPGKKRIRNQVLQRDPTTPHPFSTSAIESIAYSFAVTDRGLETWHANVERAVNGALATFVSNHDLDYLTAPRQDGQDPRRELRVELFAPAVNSALRKAGAELQWMDIGYFDIDGLRENQEQDPVDETRTKLWASRWAGKAEKIRSYGEAKHLVSQELARAEAQADMIMSITNALRDVSFGPDRAETLRHLFLARTAQILEALQDGHKPQEPRT